jgi:outer membrane protein TolC
LSLATALAVLAIAVQAPAQASAPATAQSSPFLGGVPAGNATDGVIPLTLQDALVHGLKYNLGLLLAEQDTRTARARQLLARSALLPNVNAHVTEEAQQVNLAAMGLPINELSGLSPIVGPFSVFDARGSVQERAFDWSAIQTYRASGEGRQAAQFSYRETRELVVQVVTGLYLQALAAQSQVDTAQAQLTTATAIHDQTVHLKEAGLAAGIDVLRAQVERQALQERLLAAENSREKQRIALARAIGLPDGQDFTLKDALLQDAAPLPAFEDARRMALQQRADYQEAIALVKAGELVRRAAAARYLPSLRFDGDYGTLGRGPGESHGTFTAAATLVIPLFQVGSVEAETLQADAELRQRQAVAADLREGISQEIRNALLDCKTSAQQVEVARSSVDLADQQLVEARDRFRSGVANTIEVVQAQEAVARANDELIASRFAYSMAKTALAKATGVAERDVAGWLRGGS